MTAPRARAPRQAHTGVAASWVDDDDALDATIDAVLEHPEYAIDTEFLRERTYYPKLALVQIAWPGGLALIDPLAADPMRLQRLLCSDRLAVLHAADQDMEVLDHACGAIPARIFDTQVAAGFTGFSTPSLVSLVERILGVRLSKGDRLTDWTRRPLTAAQQDYAAHDVAFLLELRGELVGQLDSVSRTAWVEEECELLRSRPRGPAEPRKAWWRLKDGRVLRGADRLVAQELAAWREQRARSEDKPVRFVLPDLAILAIAQSKPATHEELASIRGLDGRYSKGRTGIELLELVARARDLPASELHVAEVEDFDRRLRPALTLVTAWVAQLARDALIDASLLATRGDIVSFLRGDAGARLDHGWRRDLVGEAVMQLVSGEAALAFDPGGTLRLEARSRRDLAPVVAVPAAPWAGDEDLGLPAEPGADGSA
jgi:ribonuclease D